MRDLMVSWKRYLRADDGQDTMADSLLRSVQLLLEALRLHAVEGDQYEFQKFQTDLRQLRENLGESPSSAEILATTGAAIKEFEDHQRSTSRFLKREGLQYQNMVGMLTEALARISKGNDGTVLRLRTIERQIERAAAIEDIRVLKSQLGDCLDALREESRVQIENTDQTVRAIRQELDTASFERSAAMETIARNLSESRRTYAAAFVIQHMALNKKRFGAAAGDCMVKAFLSHLSSKLRDTDSSYQWSESGVVALLERSETLAAVSAEVRRVSGGRLEALLQIGGRSVLLPIAVTATILPVREADSADAIAHELDKHTTAQS